MSNEFKVIPAWDCQELVCLDESRDLYVKLTTDAHGTNIVLCKSTGEPHPKGYLACINGYGELELFADPNTEFVETMEFQGHQVIRTE